MDKYKELLQAIVNKQILLIGAAVVSRRGRAAGLDIGDDGKVAGFSGSGEEAVKKLVEQLKMLSGNAAIDFARQAAKPVIEKYPELKAIKEIS